MLQMVKVSCQEMNFDRDGDVMTTSTMIELGCIIEFVTCGVVAWQQRLGWEMRRGGGCTGYIVTLNRGWWCAADERSVLPRLLSLAGCAKKSAKGKE